MTFSLEVSADRWRAHCRQVFARYTESGAEVVPVIKANGYGLGQVALAREAHALGARTVAIGTVFEAAEMLANFPGDIVVLEPFQPADAAATAEWSRLAGEERLIATLASASAATALPTHRRAMLELESEMHRFGFADLDSMPMVRAEGITTHLPLRGRPADLKSVAERCGRTLRLSVSHLPPAEVARLAASTNLSYRVGTELWLGDRSAINAFGTVLEVRRADGSPIGYHQNKAGRGRRYAVVSGGTAHGVGLEAPPASRTFRQRAVPVAKGILSAMGRSRSPFSVAGRKLDFVEPPHQHVSMVWLNRGDEVKVGDRLSVEVRFTITHADAVLGLD
jgi:D-serine deaminase-like pyridoxal phosphate-dependent protein